MRRRAVEAAELPLAVPSDFDTMPPYTPLDVDDEGHPIRQSRFFPPLSPRELLQAAPSTKGLLLTLSLVLAGLMLRVTIGRRSLLASHTQSYKCSTSSPLENRIGEATPMCSVQGMPNSYELNPSKGTEFLGKDAASSCLLQCPRTKPEGVTRGRLTGGQQSTGRQERQLFQVNRRPQKSPWRQLLQLNSSGTSQESLESSTLDSRRQRFALRARRRLLQDQLDTDRSRSAMRTEAITVVGRSRGGDRGRGDSGASGFRTNAKGTGAAAKIFGNVHPDGLYYIAVGIGDPPRTFFLDIDTGSRLSWLTCDAPCVSCARGPNGYYKPDSFQLVPCDADACAAAQEGGSFHGCASGAKEQCDYDIAYGDGSSSQGVLVSDTLAFLHPTGALKTAPFTFGCAYDQDGALAQSPAMTDGMLGLGLGSLSLTAQLSQAGFMRDVFGHCLDPGPAGGGYFFLGDSLAPSTGMTWVQLISVASLPYYYVPLTRLVIRGRSLPLEGRSPLESEPQGASGAVVDSGSSFSYLPSTLFRPLLKEIAAAASDAGFTVDSQDSTLPHCWTPPQGSISRSPAEGTASFPDLLLVFSGKSSPTLALKPYGYLVNSEKGNLCFGILESTTSLVIIGDISLRGLLVVYDNSKSQLGWMTSPCQSKK